MTSSACVGILMLDNHFQRFHGDIGNPAPMPFPVLYRKVANATTKAITTLQDDTFLEPFVTAGHRLVEDGADGDDVPWKDDLVTQPLRIENGHLIMPKSPGWGADVNEAAVRRHPPK